MEIAGGKRGTHFPRQADMFIILFTLLSNLKREKFTVRRTPSTFGGGHVMPWALLEFCSAGARWYKIK